eukprot:NODE_6525_length_504_cov_90.189011_g5744_i0.p1 GENE.NODE_6525_length_504_cov_90.189011_g5744_i0~~NODE_6525_length_504_cov_90.189011_g5744_i0.p1  ORF type:complete len:101 (+),score=24.10 NODE_6525_length_504_cov_90.189011_g5744_i0:46-303(+)
MALLVAECNGLEQIEALQNHDNHNIYQRSVKIIETYFGGEDEDDVDIAPEIQDQGGVQQFGFGVPGAGGGTGAGGAGGNVFNFGS